MFKICDSRSCTACGACVNICPTNSISLETDKDGFLEVKINKETCINCKKCLKICPAINEAKREKIINSYIVINKDEKILMNSSSGGAFSEFAKYIIEQGGCVFGVAFDENLKVSHIKVEKVEDIELLRGSKYIQSNTKMTFREVKEELKKGRYVLYSGTPCQIAGLKNSIEDKYLEKLITIDLICHGVPSQYFFDQYIKYISNKKDIKDFKFRHKIKNDNNCLILHYKKGNRKVNIKNPMIDPYYYAFLNGYIYRECCYNCKYANDKRVGDITIGDFWGVEKYYKEFKDIPGVSVVIINTEKGKKLIEKISNNFILKECNIDYVKKHNNNLVKPTERLDIRDKIFIDLDKYGFKYIANKYCTPKNKNILKIKSYIPLKIKEKIVCLIKR